MVFRYLTTIAAKSKVKIKARIANVGNSGTVGVDEAISRLWELMRLMIGLSNL